MDSVKTIGNVNFEEIDGAVVGIAKENFAKDAVQGVAKLHG